jgi:hypothetical protein
MKNTISPTEGESTISPQYLSRSLVLTLLRTAIDVGETRFARNTALSWLTAYPGDLNVSLLHAQALLRDRNNRGGTNFARALPILESLCQLDPEYLEAQELLAQCKIAGHGNPGDTYESVTALGGRPSPKAGTQKWGVLLKQARQALNAPGSQTLDVAEQLVHQALVANQSGPLPAITHLMVQAKRGILQPSIRNLAEHYHERWPNCLHFSLILADSLMDSGESERAVALLHQAAAGDVSGQVPTRVWGKDHPYKTLWPESLQIPWDMALPAGVASALGWNQLPAETYEGTPSPPPVEVLLPQSIPHSLPPLTHLEELEESDFFTRESPPSEPTPEKTQPIQTPENPKSQEPEGFTEAETREIVAEALLSVQNELDRVAKNMKQTQLSRLDGRFPVYVIFTSRRGLEAQYGPQSTVLLNEAMKELAEAIQSRKTWNALLYYADDGFANRGSSGAASLKLKAAKNNDPWSLKLALVDLDEALRKQGEMIGAILIVGGPEVIPFHNLPNPVDDADVDVPSDNPYGTRDENYFIPEWPVGRLPGGSGADPGPLVHVLRELTKRQLELAKRKPWYTRLWQDLLDRFWLSPVRLRPSLGYTAAIWRRASLSVYRPIGEARSMMVSPPLQVTNGSHGSGPLTDTKGEEQKSQTFGNSIAYNLQPARLGYFNLHGLEDAQEWYGQVDPAEPFEGPDYPVALRPQDVGEHLNNGRAPQVVFSEACFGAHIQGRSIEDSMLLKFLVSGSHAAVGSTCTAYGAIASPLTAADLLGYAFWTYLGENLPAGEALRRAKIQVAKEMHRRQGYLDGEDQKTLISFVLYGDPLAEMDGKGSKSKKVVRSLKSPAQVKTVCDRSEEADTPEPIPPEVLSYVKHVVSQYLPGMSDAEVRINREHAGCLGHGHQCPTAEMGRKARPKQAPSRQVVTLSKTVQQSAFVHRHYARLTLDAQGKLVKLVVSR